MDLAKGATKIDWFGHVWHDKSEIRHGRFPPTLHGPQEFLPNLFHACPSIPGPEVKNFPTPKQLPIYVLLIH